MKKTINFLPRSKVVEVDFDDQSRTPLLEAMIEYRNRECTPFDVPGHKYGKGALELKEIFGAIPVYIQPEYDFNLGVFHGVDTNEAKKIIDSNQDAKAVFIINPTYY